MNKFLSLSFLLTFTEFFISSKVYPQNLESMLVQKMDNASIVVPEQCEPENMIIIINSSIENLKFESNMLPDSEFVATYYQHSNQYIICHERIKFKLTVSGPNLQPEDIEIFDLDKSQLSYSITSNIAKGTVNILTNPRNSTVIFSSLNNLVLSTNQPITNISGKYEVNIVKPKYKSVDTVIVIPRYAEKTYNIDLVPQFSRINLNLTTSDSAHFFTAPVMWVDSEKIELDALVKPGLNQRSFFDDVEFLKFYEGNIIPLPEGIHDIKIEADGYNPFKTTVTTKNGNLTTLLVNLEPISGYMTFVDKKFSEGAVIYIDNKKSGEVPLFKIKTRVGKHKIRFEKPGFMTLDEEYNITVEENQNLDFDVSMQVAKRIIFKTDPTNSEVFMDGKRIGFAPFSTVVNAGKHEFLVRKNDFAGEKFTIMINELTSDEEIVELKLRPNFPLNIRSEEDSLLIRIKGTQDLKTIEIDSTSKTPAELSLPYGEYKIALLKGNKTVYKGSVNHSSEILEISKLPNYSRSSFRVLTGSFENKNNYEASFGLINVFPKSGLSSALLNADYRLKVVDTDSGQFIFKTLAPNIFFLNWDWRIGGSVLRQLDLNFLGRAKYTPGLTILNLNIPDYTDVEMQHYFYGVEISTRLSFINISFRYGRQINKGKINYWDTENSEYTDHIFLIDESRNVGSIGISVNGKVYKSNNTLRLWQKPLFDLGLKKSKAFPK